MSEEVVETLKLIWGEMKALNSRVERTNTELSRTNERLDRTNDRLERLEATTNERLTSLEGRVEGMSSRLVEVEMRLTTEVIALAAIMKDIRDTPRARRVSRIVGLGPSEPQIETEREELRHL